MDGFVVAQRNQKGVLAFVGVCRDWGVPYSIERSRSGDGAHVWILFARPVSAGKARRLGNTFLTEAMNDNGVLHATTAFGKTVTAIGLIVKRRVKMFSLHISSANKEIDDEEGLSKQK